MYITREKHTLTLDSQTSFPRRPITHYTFTGLSQFLRDNMRQARSSLEGPRVPRLLGSTSIKKE
jgi:hypothetical protein